MSYYSLIFHRYKVSNRINVGLIMWDEKRKIVKHEISRHSTGSKAEMFRNFIESLPSRVNEIDKLHAYNNGFIGIDKVVKVDIELTDLAFEKFYNKFIGYDK